MRRLHLSKPRTALLDVVAWGVVHAATGYVAHRLPVERLQRDGWLLRRRRWETTGLYARRLRIARWKDRVPEAGALFAGGVSKAHVTPADLDRFVVETRRAELAHWWCAAAGPLFALWNPPAAAAVHVLYGIGVNAPFIAIQRYNRLRASRVLARRSRTSSTDRLEARPVLLRTGSSIP